MYDLPARKLNTPVYVFVSPTIARDYERRGVYPEYQAGDKPRCYTVTATEANELFDDASAQIVACRGVADRGKKIAYNSLQKCIIKAFGLSGSAYWLLPGLSDVYARAPAEFMAQPAAEVVRFMSRLGIPSLPAAS